MTVYFAIAISTLRENLECKVLGALNTALPLSAATYYSATSAQIREQRFLPFKKLRLFPLSFFGA